MAKGMAMKRSQFNPQKLVAYALRLDIGAVVRRLGFMMELYQIGSEEHFTGLQAKLTTTHQLLDPDLPAEGKFQSRWKLRLNVPIEELRTVGST